MITTLHTDIYANIIYHHISFQTKTQNFSADQLYLFYLLSLNYVFWGILISIYFQHFNNNSTVSD